jgi:hypothetical protein
MPPSPPRLATAGDERLSPTVSVVIPALNEEDNLPLVLEGLPPVDEIVIVDGGSADDTVAIAREMRPDALVVRQTRRGKGNALACGFAASSGDIVVVLNADGSTDPGEIPRYVDALLSGAEVAHGSRFRDGGGDLVGHRLDQIGNALLSRLVNALFGTRFTDLGYGYNAYWRALLPVLGLPPIDAPRIKRGRVQWGDGPEIEPLINIRTAAQGMRVVEVASVGYPPINGRPERHRLRRALRAMRVAFAEYVRRWRMGRRAAAPDAARHGTATQDAARRGRATQDAARHGAVGPEADTRARRAALDDTATRLRREALYDTGTRLRLGSPDDTATRLRREQLYGQRARPRPVPAPEVYDTGARIRHEPVPPAPPRDTGARLRAVPSYDTGPRAHTGIVGAVGSEGRHDLDTGSRGRPGTSAGQRRDQTGAGPWRDLTHASHRGPEGVVRYDPAADERHDLDPDARRSLPMYPPPDPSWTQSSGRHAAIGDDAGTGAHHRVEPDRRPTGREVGGRRRRLEPWERRAGGRPDLTVLPGGGPETGGPETRGRNTDPRDVGWDTTGGHARGGESGEWKPAGWERRTPDGGRRPGHLRAIPGERSTR